MAVDAERDRSAGLQGKVEALSTENSAQFWSELSAQLPSGTSAEDKAKRKELFRAFDVNGNGFLSLAEVDKGIGGVIKSDTLFSAKKPIMRAFQAAKGLSQSKQPLDDDTINRKEFQELLGYLRQYFELYVMFAVVDKSDDNKLTAEEFKSALPNLKKWGVDISEEDADATFASIDTDKGGAVMFDEFADWAYKHKLDLEVDDDNEAPKYQAGNVARNHMDMKAGALPRNDTNMSAAPSHSHGGGGGQGGGGSGGGFGDRDRSAGMAGQVEKFANKQMTKEEQVEFWASLSASLPAGTDKASETLRKKLFKQFDSQGNGYLSLAEIDKGIGEILRSDVLFSAKKVIMRAYQAAKNAAPSKTELGKDMVELKEFRLLLVYLRQYFELYVMFSVVDSSDDQRVSLDEFKAALPDLASWGVTVENPEAVFKEIDQDGGGMVLFDEFADWALKKALDLEVDDDAAQAAYVAGNLSGKNMNTKKGALGTRRPPRPASAPQSASAAVSSMPRKPSVPSAATRRPTSGRHTNQSPFTIEEDRTLLLMKNKGKTFEEIAHELGRGRTAADVKSRWNSPQFAKKKDWDANQRRMKNAVAKGSTWGAASRASPSGTMPFMKVSAIPNSIRSMYDSGRADHFKGRGAASFAALAGVPEAPPPPAPVRPQPAASVRSGYAPSSHSHRSTLLSQHS